MRHALSPSCVKPYAFLPFTLCFGSFIFDIYVYSFQLYCSVEFSDEQPLLFRRASCNLLFIEISRLLTDRSILFQSATAIPRCDCRLGWKQSSVSMSAIVSGGPA